MKVFIHAFAVLFGDAIADFAVGQDALPAKALYRVGGMHQGAFQYAAGTDVFSPVIRL